MRNKLHPMAVALALGLTVSCAARLGLAQEIKPVATVAFSGYDALKTDLELLGKLGGNPSLAPMVQMMAGGPLLAQGPEAIGLDPKRPWGIILSPDPIAMLSGYAFVPVADLDKLLGVLKPLGMTSTDAGNGIQKLTPPGGRPVFLKKQGDWLFLSPQANLLASAPADPVALLAGAEKRYDLSFSLHAANIPPGLKQFAIAAIDAGAQARLARQPDETDAGYAVRAKLGQQAVDQTKTLINDLQTVLVGLAIDNQTETAYLDFEFTATPGSATAEEFAVVVPGKSRFAGFAAPEAAASAVATQKLSARQITDLLNYLQKARARILAELNVEDLPEDEAAKAKQYLADVLAVFEETVKKGVLDAGGTALIDANGTATLVAAVQLVDGAKLDKVFREMAATAVAEDPDLAALIKLDSGKIDGIALHSLSIPISPTAKHRQQLVQLLGETIDVTVGTDATTVYVAIGRDAVAKLQAAIERSKTLVDQEVPPLKITLAVVPVAQTVNLLHEDPKIKQIATMIAGALAQAGSDTHVVVTSSAVPNGMRTRVEMEKGILGALGKMAAPPMPGPGR